MAHTCMTAEPGIRHELWEQTHEPPAPIRYGWGAPSLSYTMICVQKLAAQEIHTSHGTAGFSQPTFCCPLLCRPQSTACPGPILKYSSLSLVFGHTAAPGRVGWGLAQDGADLQELLVFPRVQWAAFSDRFLARLSCISWQTEEELVCPSDLPPSTLLQYPLQPPAAPCYSPPPSPPTAFSAPHQPDSSPGLVPSSPSLQEPLKSTILSLGSTWKRPIRFCTGSPHLLLVTVWRAGDIPGRFSCSLPKCQGRPVPSWGAGEGADPLSHGQCAKPAGTSLQPSQSLRVSPGRWKTGGRKR